MKQKTKIGLIGVTHPHSRLHLRTLELMDEIESVFLCDSDEETLKQMRENVEKVENVYLELDEMLKREDMPIVFSVLRNDKNSDAVIKAAEAGKHVMSEKPVATNTQEMKRVLTAVDKADVLLSVCYQNRFNPISQDIKKFIEEGVLGRPLTFEARMITSQVKFRNPSMWLFNKKMAGGGILSWLGCHYIDLLRFVLQDEVVSVSAMVDTLSEEDIDVEDTACMTLKFSKGTIGTFQAGYLLPLSSSGYTGASYDTYFAIKGSEGNISWSPAEESLVKVESATDAWASAPQRELKYNIAKSDAYGGVYGLRFMRAFVNAALTGELEPPATGYDALRVLQIIEAAYKSSQTGQRINL